jgi:hypothetical protein
MVCRLFPPAALNSKQSSAVVTEAEPMRSVCLVELLLGCVEPLPDLSKRGLVVFRPPAKCLGLVLSTYRAAAPSTLDGLILQRALPTGESGGVEPIAMTTPPAPAEPKPFSPEAAFENAPGALGWFFTAASESTARCGTSTHRASTISTWHDRASFLASDALGRTQTVQ